MKFTVLLMLGAILQVQASGVAQTVSFSGKNVALRKLLREVEKQTGYFVFYSSKDILELVDSSSVSVSTKEMPLQLFLQRIFKDHPLSYHIDANTISITRVSPPASYWTAMEAASVMSFSGQVLDIDGNPVTGATITVPGARITTQTDIQGRFKLDRVPADARILISSVGFSQVIVKFNGSAFTLEPMATSGNTEQSEETESNSKSSIARTPNGTFVIKLARLVKQIESVVVTGMFNRSVESFTGASQTISGSELKKISANNVFTALSAIDPSFRILPNNVLGGNINQLPDIQLRGTNSFPNLTGELSSNPNLPLFILDGFEVTLQRIVDLDMNMIASITILKDASATAIYGSRGANGVMVVSTIAPKPGKVQITVTNDVRLSAPDLSVYNYLNAAEKLDFEKRAGVYSSDFTQNIYRFEYLYNERMKNLKRGVDTDWKKIPVQNGYNNRTTVNLQGGDASIRYGVLLSADLQQGVMKGQDRKNYSGQFDLQYVVKKLQFKNSVRIYQNKSNESPYGAFSDYIQMNPYYTPYGSDGNLQQYLEDITILGQRYRRTNPVYDLKFHSVDRTNYLGVTNNFQVRYNIRPNFFVESSISISKQKGGSDQFFAAQDSRFDAITDPNRKGSYTSRNTDLTGYESMNTLNYNIRSGKHQWYSTAALNVAGTTDSYSSIIAEGFPFDRLDNLLFAAQYQQGGRPTGDESTVRRAGYLYNGNYSYDNRFLFDVSLKRDGSSQYGTDKRFGTFWSLGAGWNLHNEAFFRNLGFVDRLKIRSSYGTTGSLNIPAYSSQTRYNYSVESGYYTELGAQLVNLGNRYLSWQNVRKLNVGLDAVLLNTRLDLRLDWYRDITENSLTQITLAPSTGFSNFNENLGKIQNNGFEFSARFKAIEDKSKGILWSVYINSFTNKNILKELSNRLKASNNLLNEKNATQNVPNVLFEEGKSINSIYVVPSLGVDPATGSEIFLTKEGKTTYTWNAADKVAYGINLPKWNGNFGSNLLYKGIELGVIFNYQFGGQLYNQTLVDRVQDVNPNNNVDRRAYDLGWTKAGDNSQFTRISVSSPVTKLTSRFVQNDNILNMTTLSAGYNFYRSPWLKKAGLRSLQISAITNDLVRYSSIQIERGTSNPFARTLSLSIRVGI